MLRTASARGDLLEGTPESRKEARASTGLRLEALGSGSDWSAFLQHSGIASLNIGYGGESEGGFYHSIYDSFDHFMRFGDPDFAYGVTLAKTAGRVVLRLANAGVLPFDFEPLADTVGRYAKEVVKLADEMREKTEDENRLLAEKRYDQLADPKETFIAPKPKPAVPFLNFAPLQNAVTVLKKSSAAYAKAEKGRKAPLALEAQKALDELLYTSERTFLRKEGLPLRPWYAHQLYAPGYYTGYSVKTLPGVREAIEERRYEEAQTQIAAAAQAILACSAQIDLATELIGHSCPPRSACAARATMARMARRIEPSRKSPAERLEDLLAGYRDAAFPAGAAKYIERAISSSDSMPNAVKFFAWALLVSASAGLGTPEGEERALEALVEAERYLPAAQDELGAFLTRERDELKWLETGISLLADRAAFDEALRLCDLALSLGYGRSYEAKKNSLHRMI